MTSVHLVLVALLGASVGSCTLSSRMPRVDPNSPVKEHGSAVEADEPRIDEPSCEDPLHNCSMAGAECPSNHLPSFSTQLDAAGWTRLQALAQKGPVAVVLGEQDQHVESVELLEDCQLPGRYHEGAAAPDSPGRAWASDRLVFLPDEVTGCARATHFVASFAIQNEVDGSAVALPLPCPPIGSGNPPIGCIGAGLDDDAREAAVKALWENGAALLMNHDEGDIALALEIAALMPVPWSYQTLTEALDFLDKQQHGGCSWLAEAAFAIDASDPESPPSGADRSDTRLGLSHEYPQCETRPSFLTCFPERFTPGVGENCW